LSESKISSLPLLSIIITSYTRERFRDICDLLDSIKMQGYPNIEVVFVVERSKRLMRDVDIYVKQNGLRNVRVIFNGDRGGLSECRNLGIKKSRGDIIAFIDDDAVLFPNWAEELLKTFNLHDTVVGVTGPALPLWKDGSLSWFPKEFYWIIGCSEWKELENSVCEVEYAWGVNMAFRKSVFSKVYFRNLYTKGAHKEGKLGPVGDDRHFSLEVKRIVGGKIVYNPNMKVWHKVPAFKLKSKFIRRYAFWQGYSDAMFKWKFKNTHERLRTEINLFFSIILKLFPQAFKEMMENIIGFEKLKVAFEVLIFFALGYILYVLRTSKIKTQEVA